MTAPWPPVLSDGETVIAKGRPSPKQRLFETLVIGAVAGASYSLLLIYQNRFDLADLGIFLAIFFVAYLGYNLYLRKGDDWCLTDQRLILRRGATLGRDDVAKVIPRPGKLIIYSATRARWMVEPLNDSETVAKRLNWGVK
ncbi:hypothetical protein [Oceaniglobus ichthyenteri]|uniref:hypothetical protein n=1 Tax=Oceaniglobus ichthyenteri TaxID=2136177 RepID=UPI000D3D3ECF|nr:hypothetical protein [Oceaniglobus ichthyenteri]